MDIGKQIRTLRQRRGVTQEEMAKHFGITSQAVSKWECGLSEPDIALLPSLSAYFGVSIDELFAISDDIRVDRIQNMLWNNRFLNPVDVANERQFLLDMGRRAPKNGDPHCVLAQLELHLAKEHNIQAEEYALESIARDCCDCTNRYLALAKGGKRVEPRFNTHNALISYYKAIIEREPNELTTYDHLIAQLIDDHRLTEAKRYCEEMTRRCDNLPAENKDRYYFSFITSVVQIKVALACGEVQKAKEMWGLFAEKFPNYWETPYWIGNFQTQLEEYADAKESYKRAFDLLKTPRYIDPIDALAQVCEMDGDIEGAIAAKKLELEIADKDWGDTTGESIDCIHREIKRLENILKHQPLW